MIDQFGVYGSVFYYSMFFAWMGSALLVFVYLWRKGKLDMSEESKMQMLKEEEDGTGQ